MKVLIADDQPEFRTGLRDLLSSVSHVRVMGEASNGREAVEAVLRLRPEVTLMDIRMPVMDGVAATSAICARWPQACILVLTTFDDDRLVRDCIRAGARGYLLKGTPLEDMIAILELARRGYAAFGKGVHLASQGASGAPLLERLSQREREILALIGQGMTNRDIARRLAISEGTVKNYVTQILATLGVRHRTEAALLWRGE